MQVIVIGPNLRDQSKGQFHVHKAGCADIKRDSNYAGLWQHGPVVEVGTKLEVVEWVYADQIAEEDLEDQAAYADAMIDDLHFAPCTKGLK